jgi:Ribonuclease G/E
MTRQRMRPSLKRSIYFDCPHCKGSGLVKTPESMSLDVMRKLAIAINDQRVARVELAVCPDVALYLLNKKRSQLAETGYTGLLAVEHETDGDPGPALEHWRARAIALAGGSPTPPEALHARHA